MSYANQQAPYTPITVRVAYAHIHPVHVSPGYFHSQPLIIIFNYYLFFYVLLTVHLSIILVINQLDAQNLIL